jgi:hypothetical protein
MPRTPRATPRLAPLTTPQVVLVPPGPAYLLVLRLEPAYYELAPLLELTALEINLPNTDNYGTQQCCA